MIKQMNEILKEKNKDLISGFKNNDFPIYFIIAQPRGVSTLFQQLITSNLQIAYINNFFAKFYQSTAFGLDLEKDVINKNYKSNFISKYGNTEGINEPHEWGWFWQEMLGLKEEEHYTKNNDFEMLKQNLSLITNTKQLPLVIDNVFAMSNILKFKNKFNNIKIINLTRDLYFICNSIVNARISRYNDINSFYGHIPKNIDEIKKIKNPIEQVVFQVKSIQNEIDLIVSNFDDSSCFSIDYEDIYQDSYKVVNKFKDFILEKDNINLEYKDKHLPKLIYRNNKEFIKKEYKKELDFYYEQYFEERHD